MCAYISSAMMGRAFLSATFKISWMCFALYTDPHGLDGLFIKIALVLKIGGFEVFLNFTNKMLKMKTVLVVNERLEMIQINFPTSRRNQVVLLEVNSCNRYDYRTSDLLSVERVTFARGKSAI